jgi:hypothetical protein
MATQKKRPEHICAGKTCGGDVGVKTDQTSSIMGDGVLGLMSDGIRFRSFLVIWGKCQSAILLNVLM